MKKERTRKEWEHLSELLLKRYPNVSDVLEADLTLDDDPEVNRELLSPRPSFNCGEPSESLVERACRKISDLT